MGYQSLPTEFKGGGGRVPTVNCLRTDKLLVKRGGWGLKIHKIIKEPYGGCKI